GRVALLPFFFGIRCVRSDGTHLSDPSLRLSSGPPFRV
ncbi:hypothetical protein A2U01_0063309, partial [Trifolium medium]|nr:hypothetical protein [Trifolium medium]